MPDLIGLSRIADNPYQTRAVYDPAGIEELARDIAARGLLQTPVARPHANGTGETTYQLAFGHRRFRAYQLLHSQGGYGYAAMPLEVRTLTDEEMALFAWSENAQRQDLNAMEQAAAIQRMLDDFGWTQEQAAEHLNLSRPTIANKLRLLRLPAEITDRVRAGQLSERQALAVAPAFQLPAAVLAGHEKNWSVQELQRNIETGASSDILRRSVGALFETLTVDLTKAAFPLDQAIAEKLSPSHQVSAIHSSTCTACHLHLDGDRCGDGHCYRRKDEIWQERAVAAIAADLGLPYVPIAETKVNRWNDSIYRDFAGGEGELALAKAQAIHCPNLHIAYDPNRGPMYPHPDGLSDILYVCWSDGRRGECKCRKAVHEELAADEIAAEKLRKRRHSEIKQSAIRYLASAILAGETPALRAMAYFVFTRDDWGKRDLAFDLEPANMATKIAAIIVKTQIETPRPEEQAQRYAEFFTRLGFDLSTTALASAELEKATA